MVLGPPCSGRSGDMLLIAMTAVIIGGLLALRFTVFILAPAMGFCSIIIVSAGVAQSQSIGPIAIALTIALFGLQLGFLCGVVARHIAPVSAANAKLSPQPSRAFSDKAG